MRINQSYWWEPRFSILLKVALKNFKRMLLVHRFDGFFRFLNWFFKAFLVSWFKNLRAQFGLYRTRAGVRTPGPPARCAMWKKERCVVKILLEIWETFLYENNCNLNSYKFSFKFAFTCFLPFRRNQKQESNFSEVASMVKNNISDFCS